MSEPLFAATTMVVLDGPNALVRGLARGSEIEGVEHLHVRDGDGTEIATVRRYDDRGTAGKVLGGVFGLVLGPGGKVTKHAVTGPSGAELMKLEVTDSHVTVRDPADQPIALLSNESRGGSGTVDIRLYGPPSGRRYGFRRPGPPLLTIHEPQPIAPFDWAVEADGRGPVARVANADDRRNVVTVTGALDEQQRRALAAFACSLVDRRWTEIPPAPTTGG